jgi:alpha-2-macroglobulin
MHSKTHAFSGLALTLLVACSGGSNPLPPPVQTLVSQIVPQSPTQGGLFAPGISNEPLAVVETSPTDKAEEIPVARDKTRVIVQFNHPVVPLVAVEQQKDLPQPLTLQPSTPGTGLWINTSTFAFTPSADLAVASQYAASLSPLSDMLGQSLGNYSWSFKTASPTILQTYPTDNSKFAGVTQPITMTFNTAMDRASTESRFSVKRADLSVAVSGKIEWQGVTMRFVPSSPLEYDKRYVTTLQSGALDVNRSAATTKDMTWAFNSSPAPGVSSTTPSDRDQRGKMNNGFVINFASPMNKDSLKATLQPTITNQSINWEGEKGVTDASTRVHVQGNWLPSTPYTVTIGADSTTRYGEKLGKDTVVRFTTAPREPSFFLNVPGLMAMYDANSSPTIVATFTNINSIDYKLYKVDRTDFLSAIPHNYENFEKFSPKESNRLRAWTVLAKAQLNVTSLVSTTLSADATPLPAGIYLLQATSADLTAANRRTDKHLLVVSSLNLALKRTETEALVWVTDLKSGKPTANIPITLYDSSGKSLASGAADRDGVYRAKFARQDAFEPLYAVSENGGQILAAVGSDWNDGIAVWDFNVSYEPHAQEFYANLYTDRSIYRPGQTVYFRGILRRDTDAQYSLPSDIATVPVEVIDNEGRKISSQTATLGRFGTFNGEVKLGDAASVGNYSLNISLGKEPNKFYSSTSFVVAEYRRPEYQVDVVPDKSEYVSGDSIKVDVNSSYFFGGPVNDAQVSWRLLSDDLFFQPNNVKGYWDFNDYDLANTRVRQGGVIRQGAGKTDAQGKFHFETTADLKDYPLSQNFTLEAEITDINNQSVSSRTTVPVHKGNFYIGLRPQKYIGTAGQEQAFDAITVDSKGSVTPNQSLTVSFFDHQWYTVREKQNDGSFLWRSAYTDTLVSQVGVKTDAQGAAVAKFTPTKGGVFKILAEGKDSAGNAIRSATYLWVSGSGYINWRIENNDRIDLVADKKEYAVGETADILIPAPFANSEALLTIERGSIRDVRRISLPTNGERVKVPIPLDYSPNVYVSVLIVKGRDADSPIPQFKLGYTNLKVTTTEKQLKISVTPDKTAHYQPGDSANFTITALDATNKPVQSELSVALVDKAVLSLIDDRSQSPLGAFYSERGLGVVTSATLARSVDRINQQLSPESKGGGGGGLITEPVRRDFRDNAFWKADVVTDAQGRAQVSIPLPDNLTTWNLTAKGVTTATQVGDARVDIVSTKDLLLRPVTPRFFVVGDKAHLEAVVNNNTDNDLSADVRLDAQGLTLSGSAQQPLTIRAHDKAKVAWDTTVNAANQVVVKFTTTGGRLQDAVEQTLPVLRPSSPEVVGTAGQVDTQTKEQIQLPATLDKSAGELKLELSPSLAAASRNSLKYLESFDYECSEQTVSKFFPNIATYLALKKFGIDRPDLQANLQTNVSREVQRLYSLQNQDGGWGWWFASQSDNNLTAYALLALYDAKQAGFAIDDNVMKRAQDFLNRSFERQPDVKAIWTFNERAFVIFALTETGGNYTSRAVTLFDQRANLANYGKAYLMMAMLKLKLPQAPTLLSELTSAAIPSATGVHWEEAQTDYWTMNTNTRSTALAIMALGRADPKNATLANAVRWLMIARKEGHWQTTQETAWSVIALTEYMQSTGELQASYTYQATVNGKPIGNGNVDKTNVDQPGTFTVAIKDLVQNAANDLSITRNAGDGRLYYSAFLNYYLPADNLPALNRGIIVARQYEGVDPLTLKPTGQVIQSAKIGDYVRVTLAIIAPNDLHYLVLEDPLPAGFEAVDNTFKTSTSAAETPQLKEKQPEKNAADRWFVPYWSYWANTQLRDDRVAMFATHLGRGTYEYSYIMRASLAGEFRTLPARAWEMYFPDVFGRTSGTVFKVLP